VRTFRLILILSSLSLSLAGCAEEPDELEQITNAERVANSAEVWSTILAERGNTYRFRHVTEDCPTSGEYVDVTVENGVVVERKIESWTEADGRMTSIETFSAIADMTQVSDLYQICSDTVLARDMDTNYIVLMFGDDGLLEQCTSSTKEDPETCVEGTVIEQIVFEIAP
jgi:hypothetical protein